MLTLEKSGRELLQICLGLSPACLPKSAEVLRLKLEKMGRLDCSLRECLQFATAWKLLVQSEASR